MKRCCMVIFYLIRIIIGNALVKRRKIFRKYFASVKRRKIFKVKNALNRRYERRWYVSRGGNR